MVDNLDATSRTLHKDIKTFLRNLHPDQFHPGERIDYKGASVRMSGTQSDPSVQLVSWVGAADPLFLKAGRVPEILVPMAQLLGSFEMDHIINQLHSKEQGDRVRFDLHQDYQNRAIFDPEWKDVNGRSNFVQTIVAIDANTINNGPLKIIPMNGVQTFYDLGKKTNNEIEVLVQRLLKERGLKEPMTILLDPGDVMFSHPLLLHFSEPNMHEPFRRVLISSCAYPGANKKSYPGQGSGERINVKDFIN